MDAGWYPDPSDSTIQRYWDGTFWTEHVAPGAYGAQESTEVAVQPVQGYQSAPPNSSAQGYAGAYATQGAVVAPKNPAISALVSFFIPGVGSIINGDTNAGVIILVSWLVSNAIAWLLTIVLIGFLLLPIPFGIWIYGMVHAYQGAVKWNAERGIIS